jgi:hypothetical protein
MLQDRLSPYPYGVHGAARPGLPLDQTQPTATVWPIGRRPSLRRQRVHSGHAGPGHHRTASTPNWTAGGLSSRRAPVPGRSCDPMPAKASWRSGSVAWSSRSRDRLTPPVQRGSETWAGAVVSPRGRLVTPATRPSGSSPRIAAATTSAQRSGSGSCLANNGAARQWSRTLTWLPFLVMDMLVKSPHSSYVPSAHENGPKRIIDSLLVGLARSTLAAQLTQEIKTATVQDASAVAFGSPTGPDRARQALPAESTVSERCAPAGPCPPAWRVVGAWQPGRGR